MGLADLHIHTIYSYDGTAIVPAVLKRAKHRCIHIDAFTTQNNHLLTGC